MGRDPKDLEYLKEKYPVFKQIPDEEFQYIDGKWFISSNGMKQLAFLHKRLDFLKIVEEAKKYFSNQDKT